MQYVALGFCVCIYVSVHAYAQPEELTSVLCAVHWMEEPGSYQRQNKIGPLQ